jgi:diaminopimelate decarboxylase
MKCNSVAAVVSAVRTAGLRAEVATPYELDLARRIGFSADEIIVNGPCKSNEFLETLLAQSVRLVVVDSLDELDALASQADSQATAAPILLRVNPDFVPRGMNRGTATASRRECAFGLDLVGGEVHEALRRLRRMPNVQFKGLHAHFGTGISEPKDYTRAVRSLRPAMRAVWDVGLSIDVLDVGGGFASPSTRELTTRELLLYQSFGRLPRHEGFRRATICNFANHIAGAVMDCFGQRPLPELLFEPGRCIASSSQFLLLSVQRIKERPGMGKWLIADGGLSTVTMPTYYEYHEVLLANDVRRPQTEKVSIIGPACFAGDVVYRNKLMPQVRPSEVLAIMDSGAYFSSLESSFGFPRPAIVAVNASGARIVRSRESFAQMRARDMLDDQTGALERAE